MGDISARGVGGRTCVPSIHIDRLTCTSQISSAQIVNALSATDTSFLLLCI